MTNVAEDEFEASLILAAEEWPPESFDEHHAFSAYDESIIKKLSAHGPVLLRGGRGSGKSALLIASHKRMAEKGAVFSVYISLRYLPLLQSDGEEYVGHFCEILSEKIQLELKNRGIGVEFDNSRTVLELQRGLSRLSAEIGKRIVLLFDDAAHIGREKPLEVFFDLFRTLSSNTTSCKASIYPGVTKFGIRFDVFNDSTVIDISRLDNDQVEKHFLEVLRRRYGKLAERPTYSDRLTPEMFSSLIARALVGNMRAFIVACNKFSERDKISIPDLGVCMLDMASDYFWPLMEEVAPKLGQYEPFVETATNVFEKTVEACSRGATGRQAPPDRVLIHRGIVSRFAKPFEILEYLGFLAKRDASRGLKSGGRGPVFSINLCSLLESAPGKRLTIEMIDEWRSGKSDATEIHINSDIFNGVNLPDINSADDLNILKEEIDRIGKGRVYPYGLTAAKLLILKEGGFTDIGSLMTAPDDAILAIDGIGKGTLKKVRELCYQAVWM